MKTFFTIALISVLFAVPDSFANFDNKERTLPRMVSMRSKLVNTRSGPGQHYPIEWVYKQINAPVEIIAEFNDWRQIRDWEGATTWVYNPMLTNKRWIKITKQGLTDIFAKPQTDAKIIAKVESEVIGKVEKCPQGNDFCLIKFSSIEGWVQKKDFFGVYPNEVIDK